MLPSKIKNFIIYFSLALALIGIAFFSYYSFHFGPIRISNNFIPLYLCISIFLFSIIYYFSAQNSLVFSLLFLILSSIITYCYYLADKTSETFISGYFFFYILTIMLLDEFSSNEFKDNKKESQPNYFVLEMSSLSYNNNPLRTDGRHQLASKENSKLLTIVLVLLKILLAIFMILQSAGSIIIGGLTLIYPPRGTFLDIPITNSTESYRIHILCSDVGNSSQPTVLIEGDWSHGLGDYLGLQKYLTQLNINSCIWDKPGLGYSDELYLEYPKMKDFYHNFISQIKRNPPYIFAGWGGGGQMIYRYAHEHPENVKSLLFLDVAPEGIEWNTPKILKNWTEQEYKDYVAKDMKNRLKMIDLIQMIGVPFGIMNLFFPSKPSYPIEFNNERKWYFLTDKTWAAQNYALRNDYFAEDPMALYNISEKISVNLVITALSNETIVGKCIESKLDVNGDECKYNIASNYYNILQHKKFQKNNGKIIECNETECNLGYYIYDNPEYTAKKINELFYGY